MSRVADRPRPDGASLRVLLAAHGHEPPGWAAEACRVVSKFSGATVQVLVVLDVPCPAFTSLTAGAARAYGAARAAWTRDAAIRAQGVIDEVSPYLEARHQVVRRPAIRGDLARTIAEHADEWRADVAVVGAPPPGLQRWLWPGPVHERVLRRLPCAVMVIPPPPVTSGGGVRRAAGQWAIRPWRWPAASSHGA